MDCAAEDRVPTDKAGEEGVVVAFFASGRGVPEEQHGGFVDQGEEGEVAGVLAGGFEDKPGFCAEAAHVCQSKSTSHCG